MNLSKKLLLALAGTGLVAPMAASANELASLGGNAAINEYMQQQDVDRFRAWESKNQVTSVNQFSDVQPTDWAYQALSNLVEKYGCVAGYPNGTYKGGQAMTRFEAAALLNACLDRVTEVTDELQRLMDEFKAELATLRGRVDGLEKKVGKLEAQQFSTTTKLKGEVSMIIGGSPDYNGDSKKPGVEADNQVTFNYDVRLTLDTSFSGKDLLRTRLRSGNFSGDPLGSSGNVFKLDKAEENACIEGGNCVSIDRLFYTFPVGNQVKLT
ncbi:MAG: iron uptake porin, partial [Cyanobacteria bacterium]|nr:iron uptake porin [Cyanobacteriota bacterium]